MYHFDVVLQRNTGWKYQKRPGVDALLVHMLDHFEIVLFTSENAMVRARIKVLLFAIILYSFQMCFMNYTIVCISLDWS